jgi:hypothetical protein
LDNNIEPLTKRLHTLENKFIVLDEKVRSLERKNTEHQQANNQLWQELMKSRDKEQNMERLLMMAFSCFAQTAGFNMFNNNGGGPAQQGPNGANVILNSSYANGVGS